MKLSPYAGKPAEVLMLVNVPNLVTGIDYFENSRRASCVQQQNSTDTEFKFVGYDSCCWGITASDGPGPDTIKRSGIERQFLDYPGHGVPYCPTRAPLRHGRL